MRYLALACFLIVVFNEAATVRVLSPPELADTVLPTPEMFCMKQKPSIEGTLFLATSNVSSFDITLTNISDSYIAIMDSVLYNAYLPINDSLLLMRDVLKYFHVRGVIAINMDIPIRGGGEILLPTWDICNDGPVLMFYEAGNVDGPQILAWLKNFTEVRVRLDPGDPNPYRDIRRSWFSVAWRVVFSLFAGAVASISLSKLLAYIRVFGFQVSVPQVCLTVSSFANTFRTCYHALDPVYFGYILDGPGANMTSTITIPCNIIITLLVAFYWAELLDKTTMRVTNFLSKMKLPFILLSILAGTVELVSSALRASPITGFGLFTIIAAVIYIVTVLGMTIFFSITGAKVLRYIKQSSNVANLREEDREASKALVRKAAILLLAACVFNLIWIVALIMAGTPAWFWSPYGQYITWFLLWFGILGANLSQVLAFKFPTPEDSRTASNTQPMTKTSMSPRTPRASSPEDSSSISHTTSPKSQAHNSNSISFS